MKKQTELSLETAKKMYQSSDEGIRQFALDNFSENELKSPYIPDWMEAAYGQSGHYIGNSGKIHIRDITCDNKINVFISKKSALSALAKAQLEWIVAKANRSWKPDWDDEYQEKHVPAKNCGKIKTRFASRTKDAFACKSKEICDALIDKHYDLLEQYFDGI